MSEQKETSTLPQCYLVTVEVDYERPDIIKGFGCQADAEAFQGELEAYQRAKPAWPDDAASPDKWVRVEEAREAWLNAHPGAPGASGADRFGIIVAPFVPPVSESAGMHGMETAPRDGTHILIKYVVSHYTDGGGRYQFKDYRPVGHKWAEFWFVDGKFEPWSGCNRTRTINGTGEFLGWAPIPDAGVPAPRMVDLPAFEGYQAHIVRELQAAFVQACEKVNIKVRTL